MIQKPTAEELKTILASHAKWRAGDVDGIRANLTDANLTGANLRGANLTDANLTGANLTDAYLTGAYLRGANLRGANLTDAYLRDANLTDANLTGAYLRGANLTGAYLRDAKNIPPVLIQPEEGGFFAWKKLRGPKTSLALIAKLWVPGDARRINSFRSRKCRAEYVEVVEIVEQETGASVLVGRSWTCDEEQKLFYGVGQAVKAATYDHDFRVDCAGGIHYFMTRQEAVDWV
jgi:hypothetical protein